ncbi:CAAD domain-containing protein [Lusitaniella coriacea LEGE 07157]|uniref:CAAD domain-containing protein n=1 Tax=Lusitaniella coriacea LEGE 07157 TaxID=945747 RepID=A0A8J7DXD2_9CYAN|nr:CAAD domain-containing protein [Lusitaniella coriacea]MBE9117054.1 CAAD domain-containing protein [Lusitaniella coriacea LEGE 07157]
MQEPQIKTVEQQNSTINTEPGGKIALPPAEQPWEEWVKPATDFLSQLPYYVNRFFSDYKKPLTVVAVCIAGGITAKVTLALLGAINDIPLLAPTMELVGLGYTGWFVWRYLLKASDRRELRAEIDKVKTQVLGSDS